jgi:hypothetical protein
MIAISSRRSSALGVLDAVVLVVPAVEGVQRQASPGEGVLESSFAGYRPAVSAVSG